MMKFVIYKTEILSLTIYVGMLLKVYIPTGLVRKVHTNVNERLFGLLNDRDCCCHEFYSHLQLFDEHHHLFCL